MELARGRAKSRASACKDRALAGAVIGEGRIWRHVFGVHVPCAQLTAVTVDSPLADACGLQIAA
jgi:hypothetical protein